MTEDASRTMNEQQLTDALRVAQSSLSWCAGHLETCQGGPPSPPPMHVQTALRVIEHALEATSVRE